jgi:hypothetical protein
MSAVCATIEGRGGTDQVAERKRASEGNSLAEKGTGGTGQDAKRK